MLSSTRFRSLLRFTRKKERVASGMFLVDGWRWLEEALALSEPPEIVCATPGAARSPAEAGLLDRARERAREFVEVTPQQLGRLTESVTAPGVAALVRWRPLAIETLVANLPPRGAALLVALDAVGDPGNAGTIVRSADWFGAGGIVFGAGAVEPTNPKVVRATMGSLFHLPIADVADTAGALARVREAGFSPVGAALDGEDLPVFRWPERALLVVGNEASGIRPDVMAAVDRRVRIPRFGSAESLNAAVAAAVLMADWRRRFAGGER